MRFDVIVIGASTSGLRCAELLARGGARVGLFERDGRSAPARRTLIVTSALKRLLGREEAGGCVVHCISRMTVKADGAQATVSLREPDPIIERSLVMRLLRRRALAAGTVIFNGCRLAGIEKVKGGARVVLQNGGREVCPVAAAAIVGADGVNTTTGRIAGLRKPPAVPILQAEVDLPSGWNPTETKVWFSPEETPFFYWLIPESNRRGALGLIGNDRSQMRQKLQRFAARIGVETGAFQASLVALHHPSLRPWGNIGQVPVLLVGDAAGQVKVTTVGGIVTGLAGAEAAARSILKSTGYRQESRRLRRELDLHWLIRRLLERLDREGYGRLIRCLSERSIEFLGRHDRDSVAGNYWKLPLIEPRLPGVVLGAWLCPSSGSPKRKVFDRRQVGG